MFTCVFGISIKYEAWNHQDSLPVYIAGSYDFHTAYIGNRRCIMLAPTEELATLPALKKQIVKIQQIDNVPVVFELTTVSNYRRKSLIENNIPFITDKQVFRLAAFIPIPALMGIRSANVQKTAICTAPANAISPIRMRTGTVTRRSFILDIRSTCSARNGISVLLLTLI